MCCTEHHKSHIESELPAAKDRVIIREHGVRALAVIKQEEPPEPSPVLGKAERVSGVEYFEPDWNREHCARETELFFSKLEGS